MKVAKVTIEVPRDQVAFLKREAETQKDPVRAAVARYFLVILLHLQAWLDEEAKRKAITTSSEAVNLITSISSSTTITVADTMLKMLPLEDRVVALMHVTDGVIASTMGLAEKMVEEEGDRPDKLHS